MGWSDSRFCRGWRNGCVCVCVKFSLGEKGGGMIVEWLCGLELGVEVGLPRWEGWDSTG